MAPSGPSWHCTNRNAREEHMPKYVIERDMPQERVIDLTAAEA